MQVSTKIFNEQSISGFNRLNAEIQDDQRRIATGSRILQASDDPVTAAQVSAIKDQLSKIEQYQKNIDRGYVRLNLSETVLENVETMITRIYELTVQVRNGTYGPNARAAIKSEISMLKDAIKDVANSKDPQGNALFGGYKSDVTPFISEIDGSVTYHGDRGLSYTRISETMKLQTAIDGATVFQRVPTGNGPVGLFDMISTIETQIESGQTSSISIENIRGALSHISDQRAFVGSQINKANGQEKVLEQRELLMKESQSEMQDADLAEIVTRLQSLMVSRDAAQKAFSMIGQQSLFDFIR